MLLADRYHSADHIPVSALRGLTDEFFENAIWKIGGREVSQEVGKAAARKARLVRKEKRINTNVVEQS